MRGALSGVASGSTQRVVVSWAVKSLRATHRRLAKRSDGAVFHATNRGSNVGDHIVKYAARLGDSGSIIHRIYWAIGSQILRRILRTFRENIAYNTLPYNAEISLRGPQQRGRTRAKMRRGIAQRNRLNEAALRWGWRAMGID